MRNLAWACFGGWVGFIADAWDGVVIWLVRECGLEDLW